MAEDTALCLVGHQQAGNTALASKPLQFPGLGTATHGRDGKPVERLAFQPKFAWQ
jgi:hypothetical protein